nr:protein FAM177A1 [Onthophagus taurus]XP_022913364.1 protein FAM177A1 [Onthophagus taurus]
MEMSQIPELSSTNVKVKVPKRVVYFSDGVVEEFSDDETDQPSAEQEQQVVDPKTLPWRDWFVFKSWAAATGTLSAIDYMGEWLASVFGITTPKYQFEIDEYHRRQAEKKEEEEHVSGWTTQNESERNVTQQPNTTSQN